MSFNLEKEVGKENLVALMEEFYERLFNDVFVGFLFQAFDKQSLIDSQIEWLSAHLGDRSGTYTGLNLRAAHKNMAILPGHFNRRHVILKNVLDEFEVPLLVKEAWLELDQRLYAMIVRVGAETRSKPAGTKSKSINLLKT